MGEEPKLLKRKKKENTMKTSIQDIRNKILPILKKHDVSRAAIFGSWVRGEQKKESDVDILVEFKGEKSLLDLSSLEIELEKKLKKKVDVLTYKSIHPLLRDIILNEQKVIL
jgi:hypothetical protein